MGSIQQNILSLQVQFNSLYTQIESKKNVENMPITFSGEQMALMDRVQKKAGDVLQVAQNQRAGTVTKLEALSGRLQKFAACLRLPGMAEQMGGLLETAKEIKQAIQEIYLAHFNPEPQAEQVVQVNAQNDEDMAANDWIVERACKDAKAKYPLTCAFLVSSAKEIAQEKYGKALKEALDMCLPSIWSIESLVKFAVVSLILKQLPLNTVDCIPATEENVRSFLILAMELLFADESVMELLILQGDNVPVELTDCFTMLNRFVKAATIDRQQSLGLMNVIQRALNNTTFQDRLEELLRQNRRDEALLYAQSLPQQSQRAGTYAFLIQQATSVAMLEQMQPLIRSLQLEETRDDLYRECAIQVMTRFPDQYRSILQYIASIAYWALKNQLYERLIRQVMFTQPAFCVDLFKSYFKNDALFLQFVTFHSAREFTFSYQVIDLYKNQDARKEALSVLPSTLKWVQPAGCEAVANMVAELIGPIKGKITTYSSLIAGFAKTNPLLALHLALKAPESPTLNKTVRQISSVIDACALENPLTTYRVARRFQGHIQSTCLASRIIQGALPLDPFLVIEVYGHFALQYTQLSIEPIKEALSRIDCTITLPLLQKIEPLLPSRNALLDHLATLVKARHPAIAFQAILSMGNSSKKAECLAAFYRTFTWEDQKAVIECLVNIGDRAAQEIFFSEAMKRLLTIDFTHALHVCIAAPQGSLRDKWLLEFAFSSRYKLNHQRSLEIIKMATNPTIDFPETAEKAFAWYLEDKEAVKALLPKVVNVTLRDQIYAELSEKIELAEAQTALAFISAINDQNQRFSKMAALAERLAASGWQVAERFANAIEDPILCLIFISFLDGTETAKKNGFVVHLDLPEIDFVDDLGEDFKKQIEAV